MASNSKTLNFWNLLWSVLWLLLIVLILLRVFIYQQVNVVGASMEPNYFTNEMLVVDQRDKGLVRGQVVAVYEDRSVAEKANYFTRFDPNTKFFLKRVIGLPGETVEMVGGKVIIYNSEYPEGRILAEDYLDPSIKTRQEIGQFYFPKRVVEPGTYFLLGDNRINSTDSRTRGNFAEKAIFGQEAVRYWPLGKVRIFSLPEYRYLPVDEATKLQIEEYKSLRGLTRR